MAHAAFPVEVLTPEGEVFNGEVTQISTRTSVGSIGILAKHQPMLAQLDPAELRLYRSDSDVVTFIQGEGFLQVGDDSRVLILVDEAYEPGKVDTGELQDKLKRAQDELDSAEDGSEAKRAAAREVKRYERFLEFTGSSGS
jgi:F-type H+-transporting ATPase subunit epsilon